MKVARTRSGRPHARAERHARRLRQATARSCPQFVRHLFGVVAREDTIGGVGTVRCERCGLHTATPATDGWLLLLQEQWPLCPDCAEDFGPGAALITEPAEESHDAADVGGALG